MSSLCPESQGQMDFFGVSDAKLKNDVQVADQRTSTIEVTAPDDVDCLLDQPPQLSWLPEVFTWTDADCLAMLEAYLMDQLRLVGDGRASARQRAEIIAWVSAPKRSPAALKSAPFSFQACCAAAGVDFEEMQERTLWIISPELLKQID